MDKSLLVVVLEVRQASVQRLCGAHLLRVKRALGKLAQARRKTAQQHDAGAAHDADGSCVVQHGGQHLAIVHTYLYPWRNGTMIGASKCVAN